MAELFYDTIKDFPELTFGATAIASAAGRFHVVLDSVLVFQKVGPERLLQGRLWSKPVRCAHTYVRALGANPASGPREPRGIGLVGSRAVHQPF